MKSHSLRLESLVDKQIRKCYKHASKKTPCGHVNNLSIYKKPEGIMKEITIIVKTFEEIIAELKEVLSKLGTSLIGDELLPM